MKKLIIASVVLLAAASCTKKEEVVPVAAPAAPAVAVPVATPADAALMMQLGAESVFVGSGIFKSDNPQKRANAIVSAVLHFNDPKILAEISEDLGMPMTGINMDELNKTGSFAVRGW